MFSNSEDMTKVIEKSLEESISSKVTAAINDLKKQLGLKPDEKDGKEKGDTQFKDGEGGEVSLEGSVNPIELGARVAKRLMKDFGLSDFQAAGVSGNFLNEGMSQGTGDMREGMVRGVPTYNGPSNMGYGWAQWTNTEGGGPTDRLNKAMIYLGMKDKPRAWTNEDNYKVLKWELQTTHKFAIDQMKNAKSIDEATMIWLTKFEGINDKTGPKRIASAKQVLPKIAQVKSTNLTEEGSVSGAGGNVGGDGKFIQGNSGNSRGIHFHIGPGSQEKGTILQPRYFADARSTAKQVVKHFLGKKSMHDGRGGRSYTSGSDVEIKAAQDAHTYGSNKGSPGGIDIQVGGAYYPGAKIPFPLNTQSMKFRPNGFGVSADISGSNSFVAHGYKDEMGKVASQDGGSGNLYAFHGKIGFASRDNIILKLHKGEMFKVVDKDSVDLFGTSLVQDIIDIENKSQLISRAPYIIEKLKQLSGYISPNESQIAESVSSKPDMSVLQSYFGGNNQIATNSGGASVKKQDNIQPKKNTQIAATSGGASAEQQQKIRELVPNTGRLKLQDSNKSKQDNKIATTSGVEGFPMKNFMDFLEEQKKYQKNNITYDSRPSIANALPLAQKSLSSQDTQIAYYAPYESGAEQTVIISREMIPIPILMGNSGSGGGMSRSSNINTAFDRQFREH
jgi:hypothetical protein